MFNDPTSSPRPRSSDRIAYFGRVSTPKQKLEHQREAVLSFAGANDIQLPPEMWFEDKVRRHKVLTEGRNFGRMMELVKAGRLDWILIATFDRWGISDKDDIFVFRKQLRHMDVRLWSVADELDITGTDDSSFWRVAARAEAATGYVSQQAQKNIQKMTLMAQQGLAGSGNAPFGVDLVCYPLVANAPDLSRPMFRVERLRYIRPARYKVTYYLEGREEITEKMPLRDKKTTAYRYERSLDESRLRAVSLIYELYDAGMKSFGDISETLWERGYKHYDKPFGTHGVETILRNPIYTGRPAWGKVGVGTYYVSQDGVPVRPNRRARDPFVLRKDKAHYVQPTVPLWESIVQLDLWERVQQRLDARAKHDPTVGMRRQRSTVLHPLNGKVVCPDCGHPMVMGATHSKGYVKRYFLCGLYRRTIRTQCKANSIPWTTIDSAVEALLEAVGGRIDGLTDKPRLAGTILQERWAKETELGRLVSGLIQQQLGVLSMNPLVPEEEATSWVGSGMPDGGLAAQLWTMTLAVYKRRFEEQTTGLDEELKVIEAELGRIAVELIGGGIPSETVKAHLYRRAAELEARKRDVQARLLPVTATVDTILSQLRSIRETIRVADAAARAKLLDTYVEKVVPHFDGEPIPGHGRPVVLEFVPKPSAGDFLPEPMKIGGSRRGTGSWRRPGRSRPGTSCCATPG